MHTIGSWLNLSISQEREAEVKGIIYDILTSGNVDPHSSPNYATQVLYGMLEEHIKEE
jgi:hypothetical protein